MAAAYALRYDEAARSDIAAACAGMKEPPFMAALLDELSGPLEQEEPTYFSSPAELQRWAAMANRALSGGGG